MKIYSLSQHDISILRRRVVSRLRIVFGVILCCAIAWSWWESDEDWIAKIASTILASAVCVPFLVVIINYSARQAEAAWKSIRVEVGDDRVTLSQARVSPVSIHRDETTSIEEDECGICIRTANKLQILQIIAISGSPDYQEVRNILSSWMPIQPRSASEKLKSRVGIAVGAVLGLSVAAILIFSDSLWLVLLTGVASNGYYGYVYWTLRHADGVVAQQRSSIFRGLLICSSFIVFRIYVLSGR